MRKKWIAMILPILLLLSSCSLLPAEEELPQAPILYRQEEILYETVTVSRGNLTHERSFSCEYQPALEENLAFAFNGQVIAAIYVNVGDQIKAGDLVAELDNTRILSQIESQKRAIEALELQIKQARDSLLILNRRIEILREAAAADPDRYETQLESACQQADSVDEDIDYLKSLKAIEQTCLEELNEDLRSRQLYAGIDGTVHYVMNIDGGTTHSRNGQTVCGIADYTSAAFVGEYDEEYFTQGQYVNLVFNKADHEALVSRVDVELIPGEKPDDAPKKAVTVSFVLTTPDATISVGTRGSVKAVIDSRENVLLLPETCVHIQEKIAYVYYLDAEGLRAVQEVKVGLAAEGMIEIMDGLEEGDAVLLQD